MLSFLPKIDAICFERACEGLRPSKLSTTDQEESSEPLSIAINPYFETNPHFEHDEESKLTIEYERWRGMHVLAKRIEEQHAKVTDQLKRHQRMLDRRASF